MTQSWDLYLQVGQMGWERGGVNSMSDIIYQIWVSATWV